MAGEPPGPSEFFFVATDMPRQEEGVDGTGGVRLLREEPSGGSATGEPVLCEDIKGCAGKEGVPVGPVLPMGDMDPHVPALDVLITETADLTDPQAGGIHKGDHSLLLDVRHGRDELSGLVL